MKGMTRNRIISGLVIFLSVLMMVAVSGAPAQGAAKTLKVGIIMPLSGPISMVGVGLSRAVELYFDKVNEEGGLQIGGDLYMIELIAEDSKLDPTVAATATKKLVYKDGCRIVFGAIAGPVAAAIYQVCAKAKALHLVTWTDAPSVPGQGMSPPKNPML